MTDRLRNDIVPSDSSDRAARAFVWSVWLVMLIIDLIVLLKYGRIVPLSEDWLLVPPLTGNEPNMLQWVWSQHNEHRIQFPRLVLLALLKATHGEFRSGMLFNILIFGAVASAMICVARKIRGGRTELVDAFFPVALLHLGNSADFFWSWSLTFVVPTALTCIMLLLLVRTSTLATPGTAVVGAITLALLPLSGSHALVFVPGLSLWFAYQGHLAWRGSKYTGHQRWAGGLLIGGAVIALCLMVLHFVTYYRPSWRSPDPDLVAAFETAVKLLALGLGPAARSSWILSTTTIVVLIAVTTFVLVSGALRSSGPERHRALGLLILFGSMMLLAGAMSWGRATVIETVYGQYPLWYVIVPLPVLFVSFFVMELYGAPKLRSAVQWSIFLIMVLLIPVNTMQGFSWLRPSQEEKSLLQDLQSSTAPSIVADRYRPLLLHWKDPSELKDYLSMLHKAGIEPFDRLPEEAPKSNGSVPEAPSLSLRVDGLDKDTYTVDQEIRYTTPEALEVYLVWGINGWHVLPDALRPPGTIVKHHVMHTPMVRMNDAFSTHIKVASGTPVDYCFLITKPRDFEITWPLCDGNYRTVPIKNGMIHVRSKVSLALSTQEIRYIMSEAAAVSLVWGLNGWHVAPESLRPPNTDIRPVGRERQERAMHTPMIKDGEMFIAKLSVPVSTIINYGFLITKPRGPFDLPYPIWDGDYRINPMRDHVTEVRSKLTLPHDLSDALANKFYFLAGIGALLVSWPSMFLFFLLIEG